MVPFCFRKRRYNEPTYKLYHNLLIESMHEDYYQTGFRYWCYLMRNTDYEHEEPVKEVISEIIRVFNMKTERQFRRSLSRYHGIFWEYEPGLNQRVPGSLYIYSPKQVAEHMEISLGDYFIRPVTDLYNNKGAEVAYANAIHYLAIKGLPIPRDAVAAITGVCKRSQQNYDKMMGLKRDPNLELIKDFETEEEMHKAFEEGNYKKGYFSKRIMYINTNLGKVKIYGIFKRIANSYRGFSRAIFSKTRVLIAVSRGVGIWITRALSADAWCLSIYHKQAKVAFTEDCFIMAKPKTSMIFTTSGLVACPTI